MSARSIQRRLYLLILRAFGAVVLLTVIIIFGTVALYFTFAQDISNLFRPAMFGKLETYYLAHGNWDGIDSLFTPGTISDYQEIPPRWENTLLLDAQGQIIADHTDQQNELNGQLYQTLPGDQRFYLYVHGEQVGSVVIRDQQTVNPLNLVLRLLTPVVYLSILPAILTLTIGVLLTRRVVHPLADVIAAAQNVAAGDLATRVEVRGPQDLQALTDSFNQMAEALDRSDSERRNMLADVAHELRTPLSVIRGRLEGIIDNVYEPDVAQIARVLEETYLLERLVDDLHLLTLVETRQLPFTTISTNMIDLAARAVDLFSPQAEERGIELVLEADPTTPEVIADPQRIEQVIGNLLANALRYTPEDGQIVIEVSHQKDRAQFIIRDNGPGVPDDDLPHLFDRFWRGEKSRGRSSGGAGLGLAIARQLVEAQGGNIFAYNLPDRGFVVGFDLPTFR